MTPKTGIPKLKFLTFFIYCKFCLLNNKDLFYKKNLV